MSLHATYYSPPRPHPTSGSAGRHQRADPDRQDRSSAMKDRSAHGRGSPQAPEDEYRSPKRRMRARRRTRGGLSRPRRRPGGSNFLVWFGFGFGLGFFSFFCPADMGKTRSGSPGLTLSELGMGIGLKAGKWVRCPARAAAGRCHSPSGCMQRYKNTRHTHIHTHTQVATGNALATVAEKRVFWIRY